ncbi:RimK/LysX family protein [bacterium]|nr:RimK/LysX family protein [bacterium]
MDAKVKKPKPDLLVIGWIEHLALPDLGLMNVRAKIDTGARTSALHATDIETFMQDDVEMVRFAAQLDEGQAPVVIETPVYDRREIKNTSGIPEMRIVIRTKLQLTDRKWSITVSLSDRSNMRFPMIVGRTALKKHNIAVHTRSANLTAKFSE